MYKLDLIAELVKEALFPKAPTVKNHAFGNLKDFLSQLRLGSSPNLSSFLQNPSHSLV